MGGTIEDVDWGHWCNCTGIPDNEIDLNELTGFVYKITFEDGSYYYGRKTLWFKRRRPPLKGYKRVRIDYIQSDWREYSSSSEEVRKRLADGAHRVLRRDIIGLFSSTSSLHLGEQLAITLSRVFQRASVPLNFRVEGTRGRYTSTDRDEQQLKRIVKVITNEEDFHEQVQDTSPNP